MTKQAELCTSKQATSHRAAKGDPMEASNCVQVTTETYREFVSEDPEEHEMHLDAFGGKDGIGGQGAGGSRCRCIGEWSIRSRNARCPRAAQGGTRATSLVGHCRLAVAAAPRMTTRAARARASSGRAFKRERHYRCGRSCTTPQVFAP